jgi:hypothetical protein
MPGQRVWWSCRRPDSETHEQRAVQVDDSGHVTGSSRVRHSRRGRTARLAQLTGGACDQPVMPESRPSAWGRDPLPPLRVSAGCANDEPNY